MHGQASDSREVSCSGRSQRCCSGCRGIVWDVSANTKPERSRARRTLTLVSEFGGVIGLLVLLVGAALSESVRDTIADVWCWLWPLGVVLILLAIVALLAFLLYRARRPVVVTRQLSEADRAYDRELVQHLKQTTPRETITWLKGHDFGSPWNEGDTTPLDYLIHERDEVEHRFNDPVLEERRARLMKATRDFLREAAYRAGVDSRGRLSLSAWDDTPTKDDPAQREAKKQESREVINKAADEVVAAYDSLLERAKEIGVLDARKSWSDP